MNHNVIKTKALKYLPTTRDELKPWGWSGLDVILITGDTYIDSPYIGAAVIGRVLVAEGYRVGIISQPDVNSDRDITSLGEPELFWGVTAGSVDSLVANYTATRKWRKSDDLTPGGLNNRRPDRASIIYTNLIRQYFKNTKPVVLGGIEASLRRVAHYDYWSNKIRKSILFDAKADFLVYGMAEAAILELAKALKSGNSASSIRGLCYIDKESPDDYTALPSFDDVRDNHQEFIRMFRLFYENNDPVTAGGLFQATSGRYLVQNPPAKNPTPAQLDRIYELDYQNDVHPRFRAQGEVRALETFRFSLTTHRGCYGECNFCAIAMHQGKTVISRSEASILREAKSFLPHPGFKGVIRDVGGPTANMYGFECSQKQAKGCCQNKRCLFPKACRKLKPNHESQIDLLRKLRQISGVKRVFIASGVRPDLALADERHGAKYISEVVTHHVSGQMKLALEHSDPNVLNLMGKPGTESMLHFREMFNRISKQAGKNQFLTYYLIAAHPGCSETEMHNLKRFVQTELKMNPEQVQVFTPLPSTWSAVMYHTGINPFTGEKIFVEKDVHRKERQKEIVVGKGGKLRKNK